MYRKRKMQALHRKRQRKTTDQHKLKGADKQKKQKSQSLHHPEDTQPVTVERLRCRCIRPLAKLGKEAVHSAGLKGFLETFSSRSCLVGALSVRSLSADCIFCFWPRPDPWGPHMIHGLA